MALRFPNIRNPFAERENYEDAAKAVGSLVDPRPFVSDAYWSATHPRDRLLGRGRAANSQMAFPLGGRWALPKVRPTPQARLYRGEGEGYMSYKDQELIPGDETSWWSHDLGVAQQFDEGGGLFRVDVPKRNLQDYVAPGGSFLLPGTLAHKATRMRQSIVNRRFNPERQKTLDAVKKAGQSRAVRASAERRGLSEHTQWGEPVSKRTTQLDDDIRKLRLEVEAGRGRQVTNRDIGHPLAPVRRPVQPRPTRPQQLTPRQQQARFLAELTQRRRGGV